MNAETARTESQRLVRVTRDRLPVSCPPRGEAVWNLHPRVYLPVAQAGEAVCPYCSTRYVLED